MASGGRAAMSEPRKRGKGAYKVRQSNLADNVSEDRTSVRSAPSLQEDRPNNWDFSDWRPSSMFDSSKRIKKENPEKERDKEKEKGQSLLHESPDRSDHRHHRHRTPSTFPRTKMTANTPASQRVALEKLKTQLNFSDQDEVSNEGERNNERHMPSRRDRPANYTHQDTSGPRRDNRPMDEQRRDNRNVNLGEGEPDSNHIVGRLMQIRGYIKQASNMKQSLLSASGDSRAKKEQLKKLNGLLEHLKEQEGGYVSLLEQMLSSQMEMDDAAAAMETREEDDSESVDIGVDAQSEVSEATTNLTFNANSRPRIEGSLGDYSDEEPPMSIISDFESTGLDQEGSNAPLGLVERKKLEIEAMEAQQTSHWDILTSEARAAIDEKNSELEALRQQRDLLRNMLGQQRQLRDLQGRQVELLQAQRNAEVDVEALDDESTGGDDPIDVAAAANAPISDQEESDESNNNLEVVPRELKELRQKLDYLKNIYQNYPKRDQEEKEAEKEGATAAADSHAIMVEQADRKKQMLQNKLNDLQEKKDSMDTLLSELHNIRQQRCMQINNDLDSNKDSGSVTSSMMRMEQSAAAADLADGTIGDANDVLEMLDARSKLKKLEEVRGRLGHLKDLVQYYESGTQFIHEQDGEDQSSLPAFSDYEDPELMRNLKAFKEDQALARMLYAQKVEEEGATEDDEEDDGQESEQTTEETETETESQMSLGPWGEDPEIQAKVKKLKDAKGRLRRLQQLVNAVQTSPQTVRPEDIAELVASVDGDTSLSEDKQDTSYMASEGEVTEQMRKSVYNARVDEQKSELNNLLYERQRLLGIQNQLQKLYEQFPDVEGMEEVLPQSKPVQNGNASGSNGSGNGGRVKQPVTFQEPPEVFTNDDLYDKMRRQRILREELRQKKRELEAIMKKGRIKKVYNKNQDNQSDNISYSNRSDPFGTMSADFTTAATWGGSTTENLEEVEERNKKKRNNDDDDTDSSTTSEEDDAYPSDGIIQVEEEEEEDDNSEHETYIINEDELGTQGPCVRPPVIESLGARAKGKKGKPDNLDGRVKPRFNAWGSGTSLPKGAKPAPGVKSWSRPVGKVGKQERKLRQENYRSPEDIVREEGNIELLSGLQRQLETTTALCHSLLRDQQALNQVVQSGGLNTPGVLTAGSPYRAPYYDPVSQLNQQQLQFSLQQCQQQMYQQHIEMMQLQQQMAALLQPADSTRSNREQNDEDFRNPYASHSLRNPFRMPSPSYPSPTSQTQMFAQHTPGFSLSPVFPTGFGLGAEGARNTSSSQEGGREIWVNTSGNKKALSKGTDTGDKFKRYPVKPTIPDEDVPKLNLEEILNSKKKPKKPARVENKIKKTEEKDSAVIGRKFPSGPSSGRAAAMAKLSSKKRTPTTANAATGTPADLYRPGLSSQICGTAFHDNASQSSVVSSVPGGERMSLAKLLEKKSKGRVFGDLDSDVPSNLSLFEALRETIYSEVATLISQNENRPHFLIEIFRELQMLSSDYLRQRALYSIQDLVTRFLTDDSMDADSVQAPRPIWLNTTGYTGSEQTPSESLMTSEDDQDNMAQGFLKMNGINVSRERKADLSQQSDSLQEDQYDYIENVNSVSSLSTPTSTTGWENPFAQDSLGDTVIHLDKAMQRMREYERKLALAGGKDPDGASPQATKTKSTQKDAAEAMSSSAQDQGSESSASEVHYPRIDTHQLDQQIKAIMTEVIPILKEHMNTVCSPQLLGYIRQIVLDLTKQGDEGQEFVRFFHKQLGTLIQDSLAKFEGRKLNECGEDLLVDMSEVLFNELAFFRLMQDLDDPALSTQRMLAKWRQDSVTSGTEVSTLDGREDGEIDDGSEVRLEYETTEKSDSGDDGDESDDEAENIEEATRASNREEEELGKMRDDEFAGVVEVVNERDEDSDRNSSMMKVELAMSETKPFTRIGSDEDDENMTDESLGSIADPSETAVSRELEAEEEPEQQVDGATEKKADDNKDDEKDVDEQEAQENVHVNGEEMIEKKMEEEDEDNSARAAALTITDTELAGDPLHLKEPEPLANSADA
ncbi:pericentriolar material 1 protein-like isoform X3 [Lineus longissimus]|uniref:pericentriolar material 1 protein-like isoform X3 n=1 Tax=Lineus longissimus TaxID=88925 RepID=UPI00315CA9FC